MRRTSIDFKCWTIAPNISTLMESILYNILKLAFGGSVVKWRFCGASSSRISCAHKVYHLNLKMLHAPAIVLDLDTSNRMSHNIVWFYGVHNIINLYKNHFYRLRVVAQQWRRLISLVQHNSKLKVSRGETADGMTKLKSIRICIGAAPVLSHMHSKANKYESIKAHICNQGIHFCINRPTVNVSERNFHSVFFFRCVIGEKNFIEKDAFVANYYTRAVNSE